MKIVALSLASLLTISASQAATYNISGTLDVAQAGTNGGFGAGTGSGSGSIIGTYDDVTNLLDYTINFSGLSGTPSVMHFHLGTPGVSGGVQLGIPGPYTSPISAVDVEVAPDTEANLLGDLWYVNVHSATFGGGEIRGQVTATAIPEPTAPLLLLGGFFTLALRRRRS
jgi:hypothetical protein